MLFLPNKSDLTLVDLFCHITDAERTEMLPVTFTTMVGPGGFVSLAHFAVLQVLGVVLIPLIYRNK